MPRISGLFDLSRPLLAALFPNEDLPENFAEGLPEIVASLGLGLADEYEEIAEDVWVGNGTVIASSARISGPAIIGRGVEIMQSAAIREGVVVGDGSVIGNATEISRAVLSEGVVLTRKNSVRRGIIGKGVAVGAGAVLGAGFRIGARSPGREDGLVLVGDGCSIGENAVLAAGTSLGRSCVVEPLALVRGEIPPGCRVLCDGRTFFTERKAGSREG